MNTPPDRFGRAARLFHWSIAVLIALSFVSVYVRQAFTEPRTPLNIVLAQTHFTIGLSVLALAVPRLWWRLSHGAPPPLPASRLTHLGASLVHWALYGAIFLMPLTGYLGTSVDTRFLGVVTIPGFGTTEVFRYFVATPYGLSFEEWEKPIDWLHKGLGEVLLALVLAAHIGAALFHHWVLKDPTLQRMGMRGATDR